MPIPLSLVVVMVVVIAGHSGCGLSKGGGACGVWTAEVGREAERPWPTREVGWKGRGLGEWRVIGRWDA